MWRVLGYDLDLECWIGLKVGTWGKDERDWGRLGYDF
jgi:hypothetical protein